MARKLILIADDDMHIRRLISELLESEGFEVLQAKDGKEACDFAQESKPDLIILDIIMPEMDGMEVCKRLRDETSVPIIFLTAKDDITDLVSGLAIGATTTLPSPSRERNWWPG